MNPRDFLQPISTYRGDFTPEKMVFDHNLQEFSAQVSYVVALETNGKIDSQEAYRKIKKLWKQIKSSKKALFDEDTP